ncbi:hypothetical protein GC174_08690 [bacterium]|nr:hypothetical protein [bacterium]
MKAYSESLTIRRKLRRLPKILIHEHLDCSLRPMTMLRLWESRGFEHAEIAFPDDVLSPWKESALCTGKRRRYLRSLAARRYRKFLVSFASRSLANYVQAICDHVLPVMQSVSNLRRITRERFVDAKRDGIIGMELRFAPQLHIREGLSLQEVMDAVVAEVKLSKIPVKLILCCLRHEDAAMAGRLSDLAMNYIDFVGGFDLAGDEEAYPGVPEWWLEEALSLRERSDGQIRLTIHLTETRAATAEDRRRIAGAEIERIGHGIKDHWKQIREVCPTSNLVTGQIGSIVEHPVDTFYRAGYPVTINTDGTLFTDAGLTDEYLKLYQTFGWRDSHFLKVNLTALEASSFSPSEKEKLKALLCSSYNEE